MISDLISLIFPQNCVSCSRSLVSGESYLCTRCKIDLPFTDDHENHDNELFQKFVFEPKIIEAMSYLYFSKNGIAQKVLYELKYNGKKHLATLLGQWYAESLKDRDFDMIVPVPLHKSKKRKRGYNQSEYFAQGMGEVLNVSVNTELVFRKLVTSTQTRKSRAERWMNVENVYSVPNVRLDNKKILVVDDVITTGATVGMLCSRLVEANVDSIHIASIARGK